MPRKSSGWSVPPYAPASHAPGMFAVCEAEAAAITTAYEQGGEPLAVGQLRRLFPGIIDNENARLCARAIAGWQPLPPKPVNPRPVSRRRRPAA
jgi:hypothetical protein